MPQPSNLRLVTEAALGGKTLETVLGGNPANILNPAGQLTTGTVRAAVLVQTGAYPTGSRPDPSAAGVGVGAMIFDTTLGRPVWSTGSAWVDATGAPV